MRFRNLVYLSLRQTSKNDSRFGSEAWDPTITPNELKEGATGLSAFWDSLFVTKSAHLETNLQHRRARKQQRPPVATNYASMCALPMFRLGTERSSYVQIEVSSTSSTHRLLMLAHLNCCFLFAPFATKLGAAKVCAAGIERNRWIQAVC
eukprot:s673_g28.t1